MKNIALILICCIAAFISCKKDSNNLGTTSVVGSWHLFAVISSLVEHTPADSIVLTFRQDGNYIETNNNIITAQGSYTINSEQQDSVNVIFINYSPNLDNAPGAQAVRFNDTLVLIPQVLSTDGYQLEYKKQ